MSGRAIDHLVLPVASLAVARQRFSALGFTVAPDGVHPFGTANCCVYLADGTFLEPLVSRDAERVADAVGSSNVFVARHEAFQFRRGPDGFSALVFATGDAAADHAGFAATGWSAGPILEFSRDFVDASGRVDIASFKLAFAADARAPDCFFFTCERVNAPNVDRSALQMHANGVVRLKSITLAAPRPSAFVPVVAASAAVETFETSDSVIAFRLPNADIRLAETATLRRHFGPIFDDDEGLQARVIAFEVADLAATTLALSKSGIEVRSAGDRLVVPPAAGQGAIFVFEASE